MSKGNNPKVFDSLNKKGVIIKGEAISHKDLIADTKLLDSLSSIENEYLKYLRELQKITGLYEKRKDWNKVISEVVYTDEDSSMEAFIDFVEETYQTKVKDAKHLQELTGCYEYKDTEKIKLQDVIDSARYSKYFRDLEVALKEGGTYEDLLEIDPKEYKLPESRKAGLYKTKEEAILWAIRFEFLLVEPAGLMLLPSLRLIAKELKAPYSVIMDAYNISRVNSRETFKDKKKAIDERITKKLPLLMDKIGDKYYKLFSEPDEDYKKLKGKELISFKKDVLEELQHEFKITLSVLVINNLKQDKIELDELQSFIRLDIANYFYEELIDLKKFTNGATRN